MMDEELHFEVFYEKNNVKNKKRNYIENFGEDNSNLKNMYFQKKEFK